MMTKKVISFLNVGFATVLIEGGGEEGPPHNAKYGLLGCFGAPFLGYAVLGLSLPFLPEIFLPPLFWMRHSSLPWQNVVMIFLILWIPPSKCEKN